MYGVILDDEVIVMGAMTAAMALDDAFDLSDTSAEYVADTMVLIKYEVIPFSTQSAWVFPTPEAPTYMSQVLTGKLSI